MNHGLTAKQLDLIQGCFRKFPEIETVTLFGSRAMGNYKPGSDVDLLLEGAKLTTQTLVRLSGCLNEEIPVPFQFDLVRAPLSVELKEHMDRYGIVIYRKI